VDGPGTLAALTPRDAVEVLTLQRAVFVTEAQRAELGEQCCHGWVIREAGRLVACVRACVKGQRHTTQAGAYQLVRLAKARTQRSAAASFWPGRS
jgi:predicted GNAT family N-acyltransferase